METLPTGTHAKWPMDTDMTSHNYVYQTQCSNINTTCMHAHNIWSFQLNNWLSQFHFDITIKVHWRLTGYYFTE